MTKVLTAPLFFLIHLIGSLIAWIFSFVYHHSHATIILGTIAFFGYQAFVALDLLLTALTFIGK